MNVKLFIDNSYSISERKLQNLRAIQFDELEWEEQHFLNSRCACSSNQCCANHESEKAKSGRRETNQQVKVRVTERAPRHQACRG